MNFLLSIIITATLLIAAAISLWLNLIGLKELLIAMLPIISTYLGATLAFRLNENKESAKERLRRKQALNFSLFKSGQQYNAIKQVANDYASTVTEFKQAFTIPASRPPDYSGLRHDLQSLSFLLEIEQAQVLFDLAIEQERFDQAFEALRGRNEFYISELMPAVEKADLHNKSMTIASMEQGLGKVLFDKAIAHAKQLKNHLEASEKSSLKMFEKLRKIAKEQYPKDKFIAVNSESA